MQSPRPVRDKPSSQRVEKLADEAGFKIDKDPLPGPRIRNAELLHVNRRKSLPQLPSNRRSWACFVVSVVLMAGTAAGITLGVTRGRSHHTPMPADSTAQTTITVTQAPSGSGPMQNPSETTLLQLIPTTVTRTTPTIVGPPFGTGNLNNPSFDGVIPNSAFGNIGKFTSLN